MPPSPPSAQPKRAIVLSGGGARGAYEAGVLHFILDDLPRRSGVTVKLDILCGTSVGAVHAAFVAATADNPGERGPQLIRIWEELNVEEIFRFGLLDWLSIPSRIFGARKVARQLQEGRRPDRLFGLLDTAPLEKLVLQSIPWEGIRRNLKAGRIEVVCVTATQLATGRAIIFCEQNARSIVPRSPHDHIQLQPARLTPVHALASAAIPLLFPAVRVGSRYYADGGLRLNTPLAPAIQLGADRILVIGLRHPRRQTIGETLAHQRTVGFGNPMFLFGKVLDALMLSPIDADLARMEFVNHIIEHGQTAFGHDFLSKLNDVAGNEGKRPIRRIQNLVIRPSRDLAVMAAEIVSGDSAEIKLGAFLKLFLRDSKSQGAMKEADLLSYLLFDKAYTTRLTELGYQDAKAREAELIQFFSDGEPDPS